MDCSSPYAMARSRRRSKDRFHVAVGNDPDNDRHGIVTKSWDCSTPITISPHRSTISSATGRRGEPMPPSERRSSPAASSIGSRRSSESDSWKFRWASSGSWKACSMAHSDSAGRKARAHFALETGRHGLDHGQGRNRSRASRGRDPARTRKDPGEHYHRLTEVRRLDYTRIDTPATTRRRRTSRGCRRKS